MKRLMWIPIGALVVLMSALAAPSSRAGVDISFGLNAPVGNDGKLFFSISSRYFDRQPEVVQNWGRRYPHPDDLAVFLHICSQSRVSPQIVSNYRNQGLSWFDVGVRVGLPVEVWYVPVQVEPGWPYAKPYKQHKKHKHDPRYVVRLTDRQVRDLVAVRMAHEYYGVAPEVAMNWRRGGSSVDVIMTREYHTRHHDRHENDHDSQGRSGHDSHRGKTHGR